MTSDTNTMTDTETKLLERAIKTLDAWELDSRRAGQTLVSLPTDDEDLLRVLTTWWPLRREHNLLPRTSHGVRVSTADQLLANYVSLASAVILIEVERHQAATIAALASTRAA